MPVQPTDRGKADFEDAEMTTVISVAEEALSSVSATDDREHSGGESDTESDAAMDDEAADEEPVSPLLRQWRRVTRYVAADDIRRHLPYAAVAAAVVATAVGVWIVTGIEKKTATDSVSDAASSSEVEGTQSFDDITQLLPGFDAVATTTAESSEMSSVSETPSEVPLPGEDPTVAAGDAGQPIAPATVTVTETAPIETISTNPVVTETTGAPIETSAPTMSTETQTQTVPPFPSFSVNGSVSVQIPPRKKKETVQTPANTPSTVTVYVPVETTAPQSSRSSTPKSTQCPTTSKTTAPSTTTSPSRTKTAPTTTKRPPASTGTTTTSKTPPTTTTTARPCT